METTRTAVRRRVLIVDDSDDAVELLRRAMEQSNVPWTITAVLGDGEQAIRHLEQFANPKCTLPAPDMLLLDLKMPRVNGFEVLAWIGTHLPEAMKTIVFSTSPDPVDMARARELGAERYIVKPCGFDELLVVVKRLEGAMSEHPSRARVGTSS